MSANKYDANTFSTNNVFKRSFLNDVFMKLIIFSILSMYDES